EKLSFAQQRLWFMDQFEPGSAFYNVPAAIEVRGELNKGAIEESIREIVRRHESLRTSFVTVDGEPKQVIKEGVGVGVAEIDIREMGEEEREKEAERLSREEAGRGFDLRTGPLLRVGVIRKETNRHVVLLTM